MVKAPKPLVDADINPQSPTFVSVANDGTNELLAHEIKSMGCLVLYKESMVFVPGTTIMPIGDGNFKLGRK